MRFDSAARLCLAGLSLSGCMMTVRADATVKMQAIRETDCSTIEVTQDATGAYEARGCGKVLLYRCNRPAGSGFTRPGALSSIDCRRVERAPEGPPAP